eukprot:6207516-Pleurochrysis_carterae.AAC.1
MDVDTFLSPAMLSAPWNDTHLLATRTRWRAGDRDRETRTNKATWHTRALRCRMMPLLLGRPRKSRFI